MASSLWTTALKHDSVFVAKVYTYLLTLYIIIITTHSHLRKCLPKSASFKVHLLTLFLSVLSKVYHSDLYLYLSTSLINSKKLLSYLYTISRNPSMTNFVQYILLFYSKHTIFIVIYIQYALCFHLLNQNL